MKNKVKLISILIFVTIIILVASLGILKIIALSIMNNEHKKLNLQIEDYEIEYCTIYDEDILNRYKVYKIKNYYSDSMEKFRRQLENNKLWNRNKFYEYIMMNFYEIVENEKISIDREDLYYYNAKGIYAIFDIKNAKIYYLKSGLLKKERDYNNILGIHINDYIYKEVYNVRSGIQGDGTDYYVYKFKEEKKKEIGVTVNQNNQYWSKEKLDNDILENFKYNEEVKEIENGYYYYKKVCRTSDEMKRYNFTDEEATGYEVAVYDGNNNALYYYWTSI